MKYLKTLLLLLCLTLCVACNKKVEPFDLKDEYYEESKLEEIDKDRLEEDKHTIDVLFHRSLKFKNSMEYIHFSPGLAISPVFTIAFIQLCSGSLSSRYCIQSRSSFE